MFVRLDETYDFDEGYRNALCSFDILYFGCYFMLYMEYKTLR